MPRKKRKFGWNPKAGRYVQPNGRFVSRREVRRELDAVLLRERNDLRVVAASYREGHIGRAAFREAARRNVRNIHLYSATLARGGWAQMDARLYGKVGAKVAKEYGYLERMLAEEAAGKVSGGQLLSRVDMYVESGRTTYEAFDKELQRELGMVEERNKLGGTDHCDGCLEADSEGWVPIGELVPIGARDCLTRCNCEMEYR